MKMKQKMENPTLSKVQGTEMLNPKIKKNGISNETIKKTINENNNETKNGKTHQL